MSGGRAYERVALVGTGYLGGSLLLALRRAGIGRRFAGCDLDPAAAERALARGIVDEVMEDPARAVAGAGVVVLGTPVGATAAAAAALAPGLAPDCLVFDLGSTKAAVVAGVAAVLADPGRFVGAHPIAGREDRGPEAADADLFAGRPCVLTPTAATLPAALDACTRLFEAVGARVARLDPLLHDRLFGVTSHLPHLGAFALAAAVEHSLAADGELARAAPGLWGGGFADTTRIAASSPAIWCDIFDANREVLVPLLDRFAGELADLRRALAERDRPAVERLIARAHAGRSHVMK